MDENKGTDTAFNKMLEDRNAELTARIRDIEREIEELNEKIMTPSHSKKDLVRRMRLLKELSVCKLAMEREGKLSA